jgi:hypothetical protein
MLPIVEILLVFPISYADTIFQIVAAYVDPLRTVLVIFFYKKALVGEKAKLAGPVEE